MCLQIAYFQGQTTLQGQFEDPDFRARDSFQQICKTGTKIALSHDNLDGQTIFSARSLRFARIRPSGNKCDFHNVQTAIRDDSFFVSGVRQKLGNVPKRDSHGNW